MNRIRKCRQNKKLTLKQLSEELAKQNFKISADALGKYERGEREPKLETWLKLSDFFDVPVSYLQGLGDINYNDETALIEAFNNSKTAKTLGIEANTGDTVPIDAFIPQLQLRDQLFRHINTLVSLYIKSSADNTTIISGPERKKYLSKIDELDEQELGQLDFDVEMLISLFLSGKDNKGLKEIEKILDKHYKKEFELHDDLL
ncbi:helix-turn-helix domain-containing protein [Limosilactobacillus reuteri]|uniref:helix-turn-helix domain-containing protein n=1 Tax=Limosilactobacillus reuteri TaxID=1598 RepID=UPI001E2E826E|nr:helix-turn-helix domain-containing protein [Limosilactobacillus reuteri]MCC4383518.1 helix-turn-helix domain-containing protein [Limosilactobacillus reuteri]MCC4410998.1 helix-turn-helix domain-containing protein [Limosilactobacillus reuteri]MCC4420399.1 helix-turn-helix domain-containing protein [Limosilactobacillus reuteri]